MLAILTEGYFIVTGTKSWRLKTGLGRHQIKYIKKCKYKTVNWIITSDKKKQNVWLAQIKKMYQTIIISLNILMIKIPTLSKN